MKKELSVCAAVLAALSFGFVALAEECVQPESLGVSSAAVSDWLETCDREMGGLHGFVLLRHGKLVAEGWWAPYRRDEPHLLFSHSKSFTSTAAGFAADEGLLDLDDRVIDIFPDKLPVEKSGNLRALRVRDLLTMNAGTKNGEARTLADPAQWTRAYLSADFDWKPGTKFRYDSLATYMVAAIVERKTKRPLLDYLGEKFFKPVGLTSVTTAKSPEGVACGGWGMSATTRDLALFGQFYLQEGNWNGKQLLSKDWVRLATAKQTNTGRPASTPDWAIGYGFQFWRCQNDCYRADGAGGQFTIVMPEKDAVLSVTSFIGNYQKMLDTVWRHLYPGLADAPLAADPSAAKALRTRCARLALPLPQGMNEGLPDVCGKVYRLAKNPLGLDYARFDRTAKGWTITARTPYGEQTLAVGHGAWERSAVRFTDRSYDVCSLPVGERTLACAGAWTAPDRFACEFHMTSGPAKGKVALRFWRSCLTADVEFKAACFGTRRYTLTGRRTDGDAESVRTLELTDLPDEGWFGGAAVLGSEAPFGIRTDKLAFDQTSCALYNQAAPLMLSTKGGWVWSDEPLVCSYSNRVWRYRSKGPVFFAMAGERTLAGAYAEASRRFFPPSGRAPDELFVRAPQYNTWIELGHDQTQEKILAYARDIVTNGFPPGMLMVDDGWQRGFGDWRFRPEAFPDPKGMLKDLRALGFRTLLWVTPFVNTNAPVFAELKRKGALLADGTGAPALVEWWNGRDAVLDLRSTAAEDWFRGELKRLAALGADGFKFDGGDPEYYDPARYGLPPPARDPECARQSELWARFGREWPFNEFRATWKCGGEPLVERLCDKGADMKAVRELIPCLVNLGLMGHPYACPDMIGGGLLSVFRKKTFDPEVYVRSAQVHALAPMMQFSASPWRRLDAAHLAAVRQAVAIRRDHADYLVKTMRESAKTGLPMIRSLEFAYPGNGYASVNDQFLIGADLMVAPQVKGGAKTRVVRIPPGTWKADDGTTATGPCEVEIATPLERLPHYTRAN